MSSKYPLHNPQGRDLVNCCLCVCVCMREREVEGERERERYRERERGREREREGERERDRAGDLAAMKMMRFMAPRPPFELCQIHKLIDFLSLTVDDCHTCLQY